MFFFAQAAVGVCTVPLMGIRHGCTPLRAQKVYGQKRLKYQQKPRFVVALILTNVHNCVRIYDIRYIAYNFQMLCPQSASMELPGAADGTEQKIADG